MRRKTILLGGLVVVAAGAVVLTPTLTRRNQEQYRLVGAWGGEGSEPGEFRGPIGVAVDDSGYVYVTDSGNDRIQKFTSDGALVSVWGGDGIRSVELRRPMHITIGPDRLVYVAEYLNDRIQVLARDGTPLGIVAEDTTTPNGELDAPGGVSLAAGERELWIADFYHHRIAVYSSEGRFIREVGKSGRLLRGRLHYPTDVAVGPDGTVYVADAYNHRVQRFAPDGRLLGAWGGPLALGIPGPWRGWFRVATGVAVDRGGDVYVADFFNNRVQKFAPDGVFRAEWGGAGDEPGRFDRPIDIAVALDGRVYVVDFGNNRIQVFARSDAPYQPQ